MFLSVCKLKYIKNNQLKHDKKYKFTPHLQVFKI